MEESIFLTEKNRVGYISLNKPKANAYDIDFHTQLAACLEEANSLDTIKVIVIRSTLDKFFSAGADIKVFSANTSEQNREMVRHARKVAALISGSPKIVIAGIRGHALGGGLELAMACDIRLGAEGSYQLGLPEVKLGLIPGNGGTQRLLRLLGKSRALELLITGYSIGPREAFDLGLINHLYPLESFDRELENYAEQIAQGPGQAIAAIKKCVHEGMDMPLPEALELESLEADALYDSEDAIEGLKAFLEKRNPDFR